MTHGFLTRSSEKLMCVQKWMDLAHSWSRGIRSGHGRENLDWIWVVGFFSFFSLSLQFSCLDVLVYDCGSPEMPPFLLLGL